MCFLHPLTICGKSEGLSGEVQSDGLSLEDDLYMRLKDLKRRLAQETLIPSPHIFGPQKMGPNMCVNPPPQLTKFTRPWFLGQPWFLGAVYLRKKG
jgi:hypothetical protein